MIENFGLRKSPNTVIATYKRVGLFTERHETCCNMHIDGSVDLRIASVVAPNDGRLHAKFGDDRIIFKEFSPFFPRLLV